MLLLAKEKVSLRFSGFPLLSLQSSGQQSNKHFKGHLTGRVPISKLEEQFSMFFILL